MRVSLSPGVGLPFPLRQLSLLLSDRVGHRGRVACGGNREIWLLVTVVAVACHLGYHAHGIWSGQFQNLDVAGIVYNARLLLSGRVPYVDSVEIKPPGAFLIVAPWLAWAGLRGVWVFSVLWGAATSLACGALGALCWGRRHGPRIAILHAAGAALAADGDINYSFWMTLPFVLSSIAVVVATRALGSVRHTAAWAAAGGFGTLALLVRPSAVTLVGLFVAGLVFTPRARSMRGLGELFLGGLAGGLLVAGAIALPMIINGDLSAMVNGYLSVRQYANDSVAAIVSGAGGRWPATLNGLRCLPDQLPAVHLLLAFGLVPTGLRNREDARVAAPWAAWVFGAICLVSVSLTLRFFTHDNAPLWCGFALLIMRPNGFVAVVLDRLPSRMPWALAISASLGLLAVQSGWQRLRWLQGYMHDSDRQVAAICADAAPLLAASDSVLSWGWTAWGVYEHCQRWAPGPVYKDLTTVTTPNTNTCNRGYDPPRFKPGPLADRYLADVIGHRPGLIVLSDYYQGLGGDPLNEWGELRRVFDAEYAEFQRRPGFRALLRRDLRPSPPR